MVTLKQAKKIRKSLFAILNGSKLLTQKNEFKDGTRVWNLVDFLFLSQGGTSQGPACNKRDFHEILPELIFSWKLTVFAMWTVFPFWLIRHYFKLKKLTLDVKKTFQRFRNDTSILILFGVNKRSQNAFLCLVFRMTHINEPVNSIISSKSRNLIWISKEMIFNVLDQK